MREEHTTLVATAIVIGTGTLWGTYWLPVRALDAIGLSGAWGTIAIAAAALLLLSPIVLARRRQVWRASPLTLAAIALGGTAFTLYSVGFVYGRVAIIALLFFLTPVWSTLIARYLLGIRTPGLRLVAIAAGLAGLAIMLGGDTGLPVPRGIGEWMALSAGIFWSIASTTIRTLPGPAPVESAFVFALGATAAAVLLAPFLDPWTAPLTLAQTAQAFGLALGAGGLWWALSMVLLLWATERLDPARVGILLMAEVIVGAVTAAILAGEHLTGAELIGAALVLCAGVLEVWPVGPRSDAVRPENENDSQNH